MNGQAKFSLDPPTIPSRSLASQMGLDEQGQVQAWQIANSFRNQTITTVLDGATDPKYQYTITSNNLDFTTGDSGNFTMSFVHGLDYVPEVSGSYVFGTLAAGGTRHNLPHTGHSGGQSYLGSTPSWWIGIDALDDISITVRMVIYDALGLSTFLANGTLFFKFFCQRDSTI